MLLFFLSIAIRYVYINFPMANLPMTYIFILLFFINWLNPNRRAGLIILIKKPNGFHFNIEKKIRIRK